ncbi:MAG: hypothetical protein AB7E37_00605 [Candidatus Altimarinota bacterium]
MKEKEKLIEVLEQYPIIQVACTKSGVSRQTYYRWYEEDEDFALKAEKAICIGKETVNDLAESNIISGVRENDMRANMFWLNNNHKNYSNRAIQNTSVYIAESKKHSKSIENILKAYSKINDTQSKEKSNTSNSK